MKTPSRAASGTASTAPAAPAPTDRGIAGTRIAGLDGLRAFAVLVVILYHLTPGEVVGGYLGVDVFFVISGFLITALLLREKASTGTIRLGYFWRRRARRLLPALAVLVLACCSAAWAIGGNVLVDLGRQVLGAATFSSNWLAIAGHRSYFDDTAPELFRNLWSLAVEEQFYLVWPLAILALVLVKKRWLRLAIVGALGAASALGMALVYLPGADATRVYYGTDTHSFGLAAGAVLAVLSQRWSSLPLWWSHTSRWLLPTLGMLGLAGLTAAAILMPADAPLVYQGGLAVVAVLTLVTITGAFVPGSWLGRALDLPPLRWIGERSYGLYLWHWPVFVLVVAALPRWPRLGAAGWALGGIALAITTVAAALSYRFVEQPIRRRGFRATFTTVFTGWPSAARPRLARAAGILATVLVIAGAGVGTATALSGDPGQSDAEVQIARGQHAIDQKRSEPVPTPTPNAPAPLPGGDQITAIGDSVMLASAGGLQQTFPGIRIDAVVSRQMSQLPSIIEGMKAAGSLRPIIIVGLGTNGPIDRSSLDAARSMIGQSAQLVLVNVQAPRGWTDGVDATLSRYAQQYRDVELANWRDAISGQLNLLARDQIHPGSRGGEIYAGVIKDALQRLAELPPLLGPNDYGLAPTPL
ncbi:acyltransferase family protein [Parafrigoribacterium soli]|uniref:acyltransferase family protein n=1 Tax=Parafrigoribacterium soli TaxID=3144663 RepID=UPI0032EFB86E